MPHVTHLVAGLAWASLLLLPPAAVQAQVDCGAPEIELAQSSAYTDVSYGWSVALSNGVAVIGSTGFQGDTFTNGSILIHMATPTGWVTEPAIIPPLGLGGWFGKSVDTDGTWVVNGASGQATVYFYLEQAGGWTEVQKILTGVSNVAVSSPFAAVSKVGSQVDFYLLETGTWVLDGSAPLGPAAYGDKSGQVEVDGDVVAVSADGDNGGTGQVDVYRHNGSQFVIEARLVASDAGQGDAFGAGLGLDGQVIVVGAPFDDDKGSGAGAAYVYRFNGSVWAEEQKLFSPTATAGDWFGTSADVADDVIVVGSPEVNSFGSGSAYVYRFDGATWQFETRLFEQPVTGFKFGYSVAVDGTDALVSDIFAGPSQYGSAYLHPVTPITLLLSSDTPAAGGSLQFSVCKGQPSAHTSLLVTAIDGQWIPGYWVLGQGIFDAAGEWHTRVRVPASLSGLELTLAAAGTTQFGSTALSNKETLAIP